MNREAFQFEAIGVIRSPFKEKFGIPRQPGLVPSVESTLELLPPFDRDETLRGLEGFSHVWLLFVFHAIPPGSWRPTVRPPRLGGNARLGVFATRSTFRPNPIGLSVAELAGFGREGERLCLRLRGADLLDGTPVLDIKPYLPYADSLPEARGGFADAAPTPLSVLFSPHAAARCREEEVCYPGLRALIEQVLACDPRPAYSEDETRVYGTRLYDFDLRWRVVAGEAEVVDLVHIGPGFAG